MASGAKAKVKTSWSYPPGLRGEEILPPKEVQNRIMAACTVLGITALFKNHIYSFDNKVFCQEKRLRCSCPISKILADNSVSILTKLFYVDDVQLGLFNLPAGSYWCSVNREIKHCTEKEKLDNSSEESVAGRIARVLKDIFNSVRTDSVFMTELPEDFNHNQPPTLDFSMWVEKAKIYDSHLSGAEVSQGTCGSPQIPQVKYIYYK